MIRQVLFGKVKKGKEIHTQIHTYIYLHVYINTSKSTYTHAIHAQRHINDAIEHKQTVALIHTVHDTQST